MNFIDSKIENYAISHSTLPSQLCDELEQFTKENHHLPQMLVGKLEASLLGFLIRSHKVENILEFGTYTGYSSLAMAENLPENGKITTLDIDQTLQETRNNFWGKSEHKNKIKFVPGAANESIKNLKGPFDLIFIDADKVSYQEYLNYSLENLSSKGIIVIDNVLWSGKVLDPNNQEDDTSALKKLNAWVVKQANLYATLLPIRDGIFLIQKK